MTLVGVGVKVAVDVSVLVAVQGVLLAFTQSVGGEVTVGVGVNIAVLVGVGVEVQGVLLAFTHWVGVSVGKGGLLGVEGLFLEEQPNQARHPKTNKALKVKAGFLIQFNFIRFLQWDFSDGPVSAGPVFIPTKKGRTYSETI